MAQRTVVGEMDLVLEFEGSAEALSLTGPAELAELWQRLPAAQQQALKRAGLGARNFRLALEALFDEHLAALLAAGPVHLRMAVDPDAAAQGRPGWTLRVV